MVSVMKTRFSPERLRVLRTTLGCTQQEIADLVGGISKQQWSSWELGEYKPSMANLLRIVDATGARVETFFVPADQTDKAVKGT